MLLAEKKMRSRIDAKRIGKLTSDLDKHQAAAEQGLVEYLVS